MSTKQFICTSCGYVGAPKKKVQGHFCIEAILWLCFLIPGIIYTIWRATHVDKVCPKCGKSTLIPTDSPIGQKLMDNQQK